MEFASETTAPRDVTVKPAGYAALGVSEYWEVRRLGEGYYPQPLAGDLLVGDRYEPIELTGESDGEVRGYSPALSLYLCSDARRGLRFWEPGDPGLPSHLQGVAGSRGPGFRGTRQGEVCPHRGGAPRGRSRGRGGSAQEPAARLLTRTTNRAQPALSPLWTRRGSALGGAATGGMNVLHVIPSFAARYGGPIVAAVGLTRELARRGHKVSVATTNVDGPGELDVPLGRPVSMDGVDVWYFPIQRPRWYHFSAPMGRALRRLVRESDVVHIHSVFLWPTTVAAFWCRRLGVPYLVHVAGSLDPSRSPSGTRVRARRPPAGPRSGSISRRLAGWT